MRVTRPCAPFVCEGRTRHLRQPHGFPVYFRARTACLKIESLLRKSQMRSKSGSGTRDGGSTHSSLTWTILFPGRWPAEDYDFSLTDDGKFVDCREYKKTLWKRLGRPHSLVRLVTARHMAWRRSDVNNGFLLLHCFSPSALFNAMNSPPQ